MKELNSLDLGSHVVEEKNQWAEIINKGNPYVGLVLIYSQKLTTYAQEVGLALREGLIDIPQVSLFSTRLYLRIEKLLSILMDFGEHLECISGFKGISLHTRRLKNDEDSYEELMELPQLINMMTDDLTQQLSLLVDAYSETIGFSRPETAKDLSSSLYMQSSLLHNYELKPFHSIADDVHVAAEEQMWAEIIAKSNPDVAIILIQSQNLCAYAHEAGVLFSELTIDLSYVEFYSARINLRIRKVIELLEGIAEPLNSIKGFKRVSMVLEGMLDDGRSLSMLKEFPEQVHGLTHQLTDELYSLAAKRPIY